MVDIPNINIEIYRLDIYRLLTLCLADEQIAKSTAFIDLGEYNFDNEVNRLLILVAVVTRQLFYLNSELVNNTCGDF